MGKNPRLAVLENFKEISRIMTNNFVNHKRLEKRFQGQIPKTELERKRQEEEAASRMTNILKLMHSPLNFHNPLQLLPHQKISAIDSLDRKRISNVDTSNASSLRFKKKLSDLPSVNRSYNTTVGKTEQ